jgi:LysM repeat protein
MAYLDYDYSENDTFFSIADYFGITVSELYRINNLQEPVTTQFPSKANLSTNTLKVPELLNGRETIENGKIQKYLESDQNKSRIATIGGSVMDGVIGHASQGKCYLNVGGVVAVFPCFPETYSDTHSANFTNQTPMGRSEPFQIYQNSGPRTVNVSFRMDREMTHTTDIGDIVGIVQSACYPLGNEATIVPRVTLVIGNNCSITGVIPSVSTNWSDTIIEDLYMVVTLDFSVVECTGNPKTAGVVAALRGR